MQAFMGKASTTDLMVWLSIPSSSYYYSPGRVRQDESRVHIRFIRVS
jgi:hypothetical protein